MVGGLDTEEPFYYFTVGDKHVAGRGHEHDPLIFDELNSLSAECAGIGVDEKLEYLWRVKSSADC
jgi:hypothetical protein